MSTLYTEAFAAAVMDYGGSSLYNVEHLLIGGPTIGEGATDARAALVTADALGGAGLRVNRSYRVDSNLTLTSPFDPGAGAIKPASGVEVVVKKLAKLPGLVRWIDTSLGGVVRFAEGSAPPYVLAQWWGAVGDGVTDDTAAIQAALYCLYLLGGGVLFLPPGTYKIDGILYYGSGVRIEGTGRLSTIINGTKSTGTRQMLRPRNLGVVDDVEFRRFVVDQNSAAAGATAAHDQCFDVDKTRGCTLDGLWFRNTLSGAVWCDTYASYITERLKVLNCDFDGGQYSFVGIMLFGRMDDVLLQGNTVRNHRDDAIAVQAGSDISAYPTAVRTIGNNVKNCNRRAVNPTDGLLSQPNGILYWGVTSGAISSNTVDGTVGCGIRVERSAPPAGSQEGNYELAIDANTVRNAGVTIDSTTGVPGHGIFVTDSGVNPTTGAATEITMNGNVTKASRMSGIKVSRCADVTINGGSAKANGYAGILIDDTPDCTISGVNALQNGIGGPEPYGIALTGASTTATITGCRAGGSDYGIFNAGVGRLTTGLNDLAGNAVAPLGGSAGTDYVHRDNTDGVVRSGYGNAIIPAGESSVNVAHGLGGAPTRWNVTPVNRPTPPAASQVTDAHGSAVIANGTSSIAVPHGLSGAPTRWFVTAVDRPTPASGSISQDHWVTADATNLYINVGFDVDGAVEFRWEAQYDTPGIGLSQDHWVSADATNLTINVGFDVVGNTEFRWEAYYDMTVT